MQDLTELRALMAAAGVTNLEPDFSNIMLRFDAEWFRGRELNLISGKTICVAYFGNLRDGTSEKWESDLGFLSAQEQAAFLEEAAKIKHASDKERLETQERVAGEALQIWDAAYSTGDSEYLRKKGFGFGELYSCRTEIHTERAKKFGRPTLAKIQDTAGKVWSLQFIYPDGSKRFLPGGRKKACFHVIGSLPANHEKSLASEIWVCEGVATGASIARASRGVVVCALDAGNLPYVCRELREAYPNARIFVCGDHDQWTRDSRGHLTNPGKAAALLAAGNCAGLAILPDFEKFLVRDEEDFWGQGPEGRVARPTDFNDLMILAGSAEVQRQLYAATGKPVTKSPHFPGEKLKKAAAKKAPKSPESQPELPMAATAEQESDHFEPTPEQLSNTPEMAEIPDAPPPGFPELPENTPAREKYFGVTGLNLRFIPDFIPRTGENGKPIKPTPQQLANHVRDFFGEDLVKQEGQLFVYTGKYWRKLTDGDLDELLRAFQKASYGTANFRQLQDILNLFKKDVRAPLGKANLFAPNPFCVNLENGTLHVVPGEKDQFNLVFREHRALDYCVNLLPYPYSAPGTGGRAVRNTEFEAMLSRIFKGDPDETEKLEALQLIFGGCLLARFPHLAIFFGPAGTGKSTLLNLARRLVDDRNQCAVQPKDFKDFNLAIMADKLVNIVTDLDEHTPIKDDMVKQVIDRAPITIRRKFRDDATGRLPALHLFGANRIPPTLSGFSAAHDRRWTFLEFRRVVPKSEAYRGEYWDWCFNLCPHGVFNWALEGLEKLVARNGRYLQPASGAAEMEEWKASGDLEQQFLEAIDEGEIGVGNSKVIRSPDGKIERSLLADAFFEWLKKAFPNAKHPGRSAFFKALSEKNFGQKKIEGVRYLVGLGRGTGEK